MKKNTIFFMIFMMGSSWFMCSQQTTQQQNSGNISIKFQFIDGPPGANIFDPSGQALAKSNRIVNDLVLMLHCNEDSGIFAKDASAYGNDFTLYSVTRDTAESEADGRALFFNGRASYAMLESYTGDQGVLDGTHGVEISMKVYSTYPELYYEKRLLDRHDPSGGYSLGIINSHFYFRVKQDGAEIRVEGVTPLMPRTWYKITARFIDGNLSLFLNDKPEGTPVPFSGLISPSTRPTVIGAGWTPTAGIPTFNFIGRIDEISIRTSVEYIDFDAIKLAVIDLSAFTNQNQLMGSEQWLKFSVKYDSTLNNPLFVWTWENWLQIWRESSFKVATEQTLIVNGAFAEGEIRGVDGLNLLAVAGVEKGEITYLGQGYVFVVPGLVAEANVQFWPARMPSASLSEKITSDF